MAAKGATIMANQIRLAGVESERAWLDALHSLVGHSLGAPALAVIDGKSGLGRGAENAMAEDRDSALHLSQAVEPARQGPGPSVRGTGGGLSADDLRRQPREAVAHARRSFMRKWKLSCQAVGASFEEAGDELFTFTAFSISQWKALTTNALERINEEFRRRTKTQASLPSEEAVLLLLFGLLRSGQVTLRRLVGWQDLNTIREHSEAA